MNAKLQRQVKEREWSTDTELLATAVELLHSQLSAFIKANSKNAPTIEPLHIPRPGEGQGKKGPALASHEDIMRFATEGGALDG